MSSRIVLITHEFAPYRGGIATYCEEVARAAVELGYDIEVWAQGKSSNDESFPFPVRRLPGAGNLRPGSLIPLLLSLHGETETLKHSRVYLPSRASQWAYMNLYRLFGWNPGKEIMATFHGTEILRYARNSWLRKTSDLFFTKSVHRLTTASAYSIDLLREKGFDSWTKNIRLAPCALKSGFTARYGNVHETGVMRGERIRILTLARVHPRKGQWDVAQAFGLLPQGLRSKIIYQIAGTGDADYLNKVVKECEGHGVSVEVLGEVPEEKITEVYQGCDLYVMTSHSLPESIEGFGMTYLEAGYFNKPVIGYRTGGVSEAVLHEKTGLLVKEGDIQELAASIQKLAEKPILATTMGEAGRSHSLSFSWKKTAQILFA